MRTGKTDLENLIDEAYAYFGAKIDGWAREVEGAERLARLHLLRITLCDLLKVVSITLELDDNAQVIFETLNARGYTPARVRPRKNAVKPSRRHVDVDTLYREVWQPQLDEDYWRVEVQTRPAPQTPG